MAATGRVVPYNIESARATVESYYTKKALDWIQLVSTGDPPIVVLLTQTVAIDSGGPPSIYNIVPAPSVTLETFGYRTAQGGGAVVAVGLIQAVFRKDTVTTISSPSGGTITVRTFRYVVLKKLAAVIVGGPQLDFYGWTADPNIAGDCTEPFNTITGTYAFSICPDWVGF